jgi:hypothetical protein
LQTRFDLRSGSFHGKRYGNRLYLTAAISGEPIVSGASNTLYADVKCPKCGKNVASGIGFRIGKVAGLSYKLGQKIAWDAPSRPPSRPPNGSLKTIGYFECDNLQCESWHDCYPEVQEALIVIADDVIAEAKPTVHKPGEIDFDIIESKDVT